MDLKKIAEKIVGTSKEEAKELNRLYGKVSTGAVDFNNEVGRVFRNDKEKMKKLNDLFGDLYDILDEIGDVVFDFEIEK